MSSPEPPSSACAEHLAALHRFVFLMTAGAAARADAIFESLLERAAARFAQIRCSRQAAEWLFAEARLECRRVDARSAGAGEKPSGDPDDDTHRLASAFGALPEPERAALALFYLYLFSRLELAAVLGVRPEELGLLLLRARALLQTHPALNALVDGDEASVLAAAR